MEGHCGIYSERCGSSTVASNVLKRVDAIPWAEFSSPLGFGKVTRTFLNLALFGNSLLPMPFISASPH
jgi:hypothetical protein